MGPSETIFGLSGSSQLLLSCRNPPVPCHIPQLTLLTGSFKHVSLKGLWQALPLYEVQKANLQLGFYGVPSPPGVSWDPSGLSPVWYELYRSLKVPSPWQGGP